MIIICSMSMKMNDAYGTVTVTTPSDYEVIDHVGNENTSTVNSELHDIVHQYENVL